MTRKTEGGGRLGRLVLVVAAGLAVLLAGPGGIGIDVGSAAPEVADPKPEVGRASRFAESRAVRDLPESRADDRPSAARQADYGRRPPPTRPGGPRRAPSGAEPLIQSRTGLIRALVPNPSTFEGVSSADHGNCCIPPDVAGDVGPNHYLQWVNVKLNVYARNGAELTKIKGPVDGNSLFAELAPGSACRETNRGDPVVLYDQAADRWFMSQFAFQRDPEGNVSAPFAQCVAVSKTPDPTGAFYAYQFEFDTFPDYGKFGIWPDAYYGMANMYAGESFLGTGAFAMEREKMLAGVPDARIVKFRLAPNVAFSLNPADWDGPTPPPAGSPAPYVGADFGNEAATTLNLFLFHVDWANPSASTFGSQAGEPLTPSALSVSLHDLVSNGCGFCVPQPGTSARLDQGFGWMLYRMQYRNFGTHESMVVTYAADVGDGHPLDNRSGNRWYELRKTGGSAWGVFQESTFAPDDGAYRWLGSIAMDRDGNLALGYSISSETLFPSIRYTGRLRSDPPNTLQAEQTMFAGSGSQTDSSGRWGDYSSLAIDPIDDCTFWHANEYYAVTSARGWRVRIGSFRFPECGQGGGTPGTPNVAVSIADAPDPATVGADLTYQVTVSNVGDAPAEGVVLTDVLPGSVSLQSVSAGCNGVTTVTCAIGTLAAAGQPGDTVVITIVVRPTAPGQLSNTVSATATSPDPTPGNDSATAITQVNAAGGGGGASTRLRMRAPLDDGSILEFCYTLDGPGDTSWYLTDSTAGFAYGSLASNLKLKKGKGSASDSAGIHLTVGATDRVVASKMSAKFRLGGSGKVKVNDKVFGKSSIVDPIVETFPNSPPCVTAAQLLSGDPRALIVPLGPGAPADDSPPPGGPKPRGQRGGGRVR